MITLSGKIRDLKKIDFVSKDNVAKSRYELLVDVGYNYPVKVRVEKLESTFTIGSDIKIEVFSNAWHTTEKRYIPVTYYPISKK